MKDLNSKRIWTSTTTREQNEKNMDDLQYEKREESLWYKRKRRDPYMEARERDTMILETEKSEEWTS